MKPDTVLVRTTQQMDLFPWAKAQADAIAELDVKRARVQKQLEDDTTTLEESQEYVDLVEAKEALAAAKKEAVERNRECVDAHALVVKMRKALKKNCPAILASVRDGKKAKKAILDAQHEARVLIAKALANGEVP